MMAINDYSGFFSGVALNSSDVTHMPNLDLASDAGTTFSLAFAPTFANSSTSGPYEPAANTTNTGATAAMDKQLQHIVDKLIVFGIPSIIVIGFLGNTLSFIVFVCTHLRYQSCSVYLAFLNIVDMGFLLSLGIIWFEWLQVNLFHRQVMCQCIIYLSYICAFLSSWTVVTFTIERYIVVFYPLKKHVLCTPRRAKMIVLVILVTALILYSFSTWMNGVVKTDGKRRCIPLRRYNKVQQGLAAVDTLITFVVPSLLIIVLNIGIVIKICDFIYRRGKTGRFAAEESIQMDGTLRTGQFHCSKGAASAQGKLPCGSGLPKNSSNSGQDKATAGSSSANGGVVGGGTTPTKQQLSRMSRSNSQKRQMNFIFSSPAVHHGNIPCVRHSYQIRTTRALVIVSSVYVLLNLPSHAFRTIACIMYLTDTTYAFSKRTLIWQNVLQLVYYLNFASNVFLYSASSRSFRGALRRLMTRWCQKVQSAYAKMRNKRLTGTLRKEMNQKAVPI